MYHMCSGQEVLHVTADEMKAKFKKTLETETEDVEDHSLPSLLIFIICTSKFISLILAALYI